MGVSMIGVSECLRTSENCESGFYLMHLTLCT